MNTREELRSAVGDLSGVEVFNTQVLVAVYIRPEKTSGGIIRPDSVREEDKYQGKVGLLLKKGRTAFIDEEARSHQDIPDQEGRPQELLDDAVP